MQQSILLMTLACAILLTGCTVKWLPDAESALNPPVAIQQKFIADALDQVFSRMDFSKLSGKVVDIEVVGVYADGDVEDYIRARIQAELAKAGAISEVDLVEKPVTHKANVMMRYGGVNDFVTSTLFYEYRVKQYAYDVEVNVFSVNGQDQFTVVGQGDTEATISRAFYLLFFPIPLPNAYSTRKGRSFFSQVNETYDAAKKGTSSSSARRNRGNIMQVLPAR
jgi:hypothetical protein